MGVASRKTVPSYSSGPSRARFAGLWPWRRRKADAPAFSPIQTLVTLGLPLLLAAWNAAAQMDYTEARAALVDEIEDSVRRAQPYTDIGRLDRAVMNAIAAVPRHEFVPAGMRRFAYENRPLPIGADQTISQPTIVALMTHLAEVDAGSVVLEVGTGSGYQAAVLAEIADAVYTIEIVETLGRQARATLERLGYDNVQVRIGDGYRGWPEQAPFDAIVVTAAPETVPPPLIEQLKPGGRLVIPVGPQAGAQSLQVLRKEANGEVRTSDVLPVVFVPFTRDED